MGTGKMKKMSRQQQKAVGASMNEAAGKFEQAWMDMEAARERLGEKNKANSHHSHHWVLPKVR